MAFLTLVPRSKASRVGGATRAHARLVRRPRLGAPSRLVGSLVLALASVLACDESTAPLGRGDDTFGIDATSAPPADGDASSVAVLADSPFAVVDAPYGPPPDGYAPVAWCAQCACPVGTYCFGGGTGQASFSGTCLQADAGAAGIGCRPIPPGCTSPPYCPCLLQSLAPMPCYPVCTEVGGFTVYCPHP